MRVEFMEKNSGPNTRKFKIATYVYLAIVVGFAWYRGFFDPKGTPLEPQEWGDVLAGVFSQLAFLWLIYASLSQRAELELQREELRQNNGTQRDQKAAMDEQALALGAQVNRLEAEATARYEPIIVLDRKNFNSTPFAVILKNVGGTVINVRFSDNMEPMLVLGEDENRKAINVVSHWLTGERVRCEIPTQIHIEDFVFAITMTRLDSIEIVHTYTAVYNFSRFIINDRNPIPYVDPGQLTGGSV